MTTREAMYQRHSVRYYTSAKIPSEIVHQLQERTKALNQAYGLSMRLMIEDTHALSLFAEIFLAKSVRNYWILSAKNQPSADEKLGYCGADLMLYAQSIGLNTWWVGETFNRKAVSNIVGNSKVVGIIAVGYGENPGKPHKSKLFSDVSSYKGEMPNWFRCGVEAALLAPTAMGKQMFFLRGESKKVSMRCSQSTYANVECGIIKYHFELGAGRENFEWCQ